MAPLCLGCQACKKQAKVLILDEAKPRSGVVKGTELTLALPAQEDGKVLYWGLLSTVLGLPPCKYSQGLVLL